MIGNVNEWCSDWYSKLYSQPILDPVGPEQGKEKTFRGGGLFDSNKTLDPSRRNKKGNMYRNAGNGFRLCLKESVVKKVEGPVLEKAWSVPSIGMEMIWCNPGTFNVGSPEDEIGRDTLEDLREVTIDNGFYLGKFEVKQSEFNDIMGYHPETKYIGNNLPALNVSWSEAVEFCDKLTALEAKRGRLPEGWVFTLPSEDQWEYAARAGTNSAYHWGDLIEPERANYKTNINSRPMVIGSYDSNNWGFHDVSGNALEWCMVSKLRGGSWRSSKYAIRLACRNHPDNFTATIGFRVSLQKAPDAGDLSFLKIEDWIIPSVGLEMIWCKPGTFLMGSPKDEPQREDNEFQQKISINLGFFLGKYEITQQEYETVMHTNPSKFKNKRLPVETVSLNDALNFCEKLTELERKRGNLTPGWVYKLPTEVQWEYACRAGTNTRWSYGDSISLKDANFAGDKKNDLKKTSEVGKYKPNPWGFYDMHGNVEEWCSGTSRQQNGVTRGGSFRSAWHRTRSATRQQTYTFKKHNTLGFRISYQKK